MLSRLQRPARRPGHSQRVLSHVPAFSKRKSHASLLNSIIKRHGIRAVLLLKVCPYRPILHCRCGVYRRMSKIYRSLGSSIMVYHILCTGRPRHRSPCCEYNRANDKHDITRDCINHKLTSDNTKSIFYYAIKYAFDDLTNSDSEPSSI